MLLNNYISLYKLNNANFLHINLERSIAASCRLNFFYDIFSILLPKYIMLFLKIYAMKPEEILSQ